MHRHPLVSVTYDGFYSATVSIRPHSLRSESTPKRATNCAARGLVAARPGKPGRQTAAALRSSGQASRRTPHEPRLPNTPREIRPLGRADLVVKERFFGPRQEGRSQLRRCQVDSLQNPLQGVVGVDFLEGALAKARTYTQAGKSEVCERACLVRVLVRYGIHFRRLYDTF